MKMKSDSRFWFVRLDGRDGTVRFLVVDLDAADVIAECFHPSDAAALADALNDTPIPERVKVEFPKLTDLTKK